MTYVSGIFQRGIKSLPLATELHEDQGSHYVAGAQLLDVSRRISKGGSVLPAEMPKRFFCEFSDKKLPKKLPAFGMGSVYLATDPLRAVLEAHDMGDGFFWDVDLFESDQSTRHPTNVSGIHIGTWKSALRGEHCHTLRKIVDQPPLWMLEKPIEDGDVVVGSEAETGADIWRDTFAPTLLFFSDRLMEALKSAKQEKVFSPQKCGVI